MQQPPIVAALIRPVRAETICLVSTSDLWSNQRDSPKTSSILDRLKAHRQIIGFVLILGIILVYTGLVFVGMYFQTSDGRTCQFTLWQIRCFQFVGVAPVTSDGANRILLVIQSMILPLGILLIIVPLVALLWIRFKGY